MNNRYVLMINRYQVVLMICVDIFYENWFTTYFDNHYHTFNSSVHIYTLLQMSPIPDTDLATTPLCGLLVHLQTNQGHSQDCVHDDRRFTDGSQEGIEVEEHGQGAEGEGARPSSR